MKKELITAIYCRTARECDIGIESQEAMLRQYAADKDFGNVSVYTDNGYSGLELDRPALNRLQADIDAGLVGRLLVKDLTRISRDFLATPKFLDDIVAKGVEIISVADNFNYGNFTFAKSEFMKAVMKFAEEQKKKT